MSSSRGSLTPPSLPAGRLADNDDGTELVVRGRSFPRSPPPAEIEPAESSAPAVAQLQPVTDSAADVQDSPFAVELPAQEAAAASLELQPMLSGTAGDSSAMMDADAAALPGPPAWQPPAHVIQLERRAEPPGYAAERGGVVADQRPSSVQAGSGKRDWHAAIRQRLKLRVRAGPSHVHFHTSHAHFHPSQKLMPNSRFR